MDSNQLSITVPTLIEVSNLLGLHLEDFSPIRLRQQEELVRNLQDKTSSTLAKPEQKKHFFVSALDFLVYKDNGEKKFKFTEINGSGFTGTSNISLWAIQTILRELAQVPHYINDKLPIIAVPCSGTKEITTSGRPSLMYEKILFAQAIKEGFQNILGSGSIVTLYDLLQNEAFAPKVPTVVIGYLMDLMRYLDCKDGKIYLLDQPLSGATHDRFADNLINAYKDQIDLNKFYSINNLYLYTADKGSAYTLFNKFIEEKHYPSLNKKIDYVRVFSRDELISAVLKKVHSGEKVVIKPHGAALGRGIDFFVTPLSDEEIITKIDDSIQATNRFCGVSGWAFPYTVVDYTDSCTIPNKDYPLFGHKFEIRVIVYRDEDKIKAFPAIVKISSKFYEPDNPDRLMLLNNVAAAAGRTKLDSFHYMLPLSNLDTLNIIGLDLDQLTELSSFCTEYVKFAINTVATQPISLKDHYAPSLVT